MARQISPTITGTADTLDALAPGQRFWFWLCRQNGVLSPRLLLSSMADDPAMDELREAGRALTLPPTATVEVGMGGLDLEGRVQFSGNVSVDDLLAIAEWTAINAPTNPGLQRLKDARFARVSPKGQVLEIFEDPQLWEGIAARAPIGAPEAAGRALERLTEGDQAWLWADGRSLLIIPMAEDPKGRLFRQLIRTFRLQRPQDGQDFGGIIVRQPQALLVTSSQPIEDGQAALSTLMAAHPDALAGLVGARLAEMNGADFVKTIQLESGGADLRHQSAALAAMSPGREPLWFWFSATGGDGQPILLLEDGRDALKDAAQAIDAAGQTWRGQCAVSKKGWIEFRTRNDYKNFLPTLAAWVAMHEKRWPEVRKLVGARMTVRDRDGEIVERYKDEDAWKPLEG